MENQRQHSRQSVRTLVTVLIESQDRPSALQVYKAWTEDISASGMKFACNEELPPGELYVRILLPGLDDKIVACTVMRRGRRESTGLMRTTGPRFTYGVRFTRVRSYEEFRSANESLTDEQLAGSAP